ncbi:MAG: single-stranded DNA-binding protein [Candidatus Marinimicrobia bacterium]|nr:single-stranded DNA-binding protein [Candidatus Neomarinimicrobiota bacterium]MCH7858409.1 single-stranded DNA-binding protein [Candidatus Neomarinimicrobiota bacterium]
MMDLRMPDLNMVLLAGNLTNDPKYSETRNATPVVNFYMASNKRFKDRNGVVKEDVCFVGVVAWDNLAVSCRDNLLRGSSVLVTGELQSRKLYAEDGTTRNMVEIKAKKIQFLDAHREMVEVMEAER